MAHSLGRRLAYVYEVEELVPGERFVMATSKVRHGDDSVLEQRAQ